MNFLIRLVVIVCILLGAYGVRVALIKSKPEPKSKEIVKIIPLVNVIEVAAEEHRPEIKSFGTVRSFFETSLSPEVEGRIISVAPNFQVGEMVAEGEILVTIDSANFEADLATAKAELILMQSALDEEKVRVKQAKDDWIASGRKLETASDFVLRKPQMAAAEANIEAAKVEIDKANLNLDRTHIRAPYAAIVTSRSASLGNFANSQTSLGTLVATGKAEVRIPLTPEQMQRVVFSDKNKPQIKLKDPNNKKLEWIAELTRMEPVVDAQNQVNYGIATINDPYTNEVGPLPVGTFVNVILPSATAFEGYKLPESALVNDQYVWLVNEESKLVRVRAERIQNEGSETYVKIDAGKLNSPLRVISRPLSTFRSGSEVKTVDEDAASKK